MSIAENEKFFFVHIMKTGGTSFSQVIADNFSRERCYPYSSESENFFEGMESYVHVPKFTENVNSDRHNLRMISAHVPLAVKEFLLEDYRTLTLLRDPVDRTISYLKHCRRYHIEHQNMALEDIYDDFWFRASFMQNYQTKIFSMTPDESIEEHRLKDHHPTMPPRKEINLDDGFKGELAEFKDLAPGRFCLEFFAPSTGVITIDDKRFETATQNLRALDIVGVTDRFDRFLQRLSQQFAWKVRELPKQHVGEKDKISQELRSRIAKDNEYDQELYRYAQSIA